MILVGLYRLWIILVGWLRPEACPPVVRAEDDTERMGARVLRALVPPASLVVLVLGSILLGLATPTEAASLGCVGAILLAGRAVGEGTGQAWPVYLAAGCLAALVPLVTNFDLRMQRNVVPVEDAVAAIVAGPSLLAFSFGIAAPLLRVYRSGLLSEVMPSPVSIQALVAAFLLGASAL